MFDWLKKSSRTSKDRASILAQAEDRLVALIPTRVKAIGIQEPVYCLRIWYYGTDTGGDRVPSLMLVKESVRRRRIAEKGANVPHHLWSADELTEPSGVYTAEFKDAILAKLCRQWYDQPWGEKPETEELLPIREMVQRVATRLNGLPWDKHVPVTNDFVIFAADASHTFSDDYGEMLASVPRERVELLRSRGFLGTRDWYRLDTDSSENE